MQYYAAYWHNDDKTRQYVILYIESIAVYHQISNISHTKSQNFNVSSCSCLCPIYWSQVLSREWRCSWNSANRRCSNHIWVINNFISYWGATYIRGLMVFTKYLFKTWNTWLVKIILRCLYFQEPVGPLQGVVIAVSKKLSSKQSEYNDIASSLGAEYRWTFDESCTHFIFQVGSSKINAS